MMMSSNGNIFHVTGLLCGEFTGHRWIPRTKPVTQSFNVFFDLRLNKRLSKQSRRRWFEKPSRSLWRHCNGEIEGYEELGNMPNQPRFPYVRKEKRNFKMKRYFSIFSCTAKTPVTKREHCKEILLFFKFVAIRNWYGTEVTHPNNGRLTNVMMGYATLKKEL